MKYERPRQKVLQAALQAALLMLLLSACGDDGKPSDDTSPGGPTAEEQEVDPADLLDERSPFGSATPATPPRLSPCTEADREMARAVWTKLRQVDYPYHLQTVALSPRFRSGCRALIIAEPPPAMTLDSLDAVAPHLFANRETLQHKIGYDGWTQDVVVTLPPVEEAELDELIAVLHDALFGTTYRMQVLDTSKPAPRHDPKAAPLDITVGAGDLNRWLLEENSAFQPLHGGEPVAFKDLLRADEPDVYVDAASGLVAWIIPRQQDIAQLQGMFRQFTLESDVIVGAVASDTTVAIVARQRVVDPLILQPLRFETVSLLAACDKDGLAQSYDRSDALAGRIDAKRDWAPIFLSPVLLDTEYGSLLDITDQLLKSWSNNGKTQYINFPYLSPRKWAFPAPVFVVAKSESFRYVWNTANIGAVVDVPGLSIFWTRRTGALNVSYFPDEVEDAAPVEVSPAVRELEENAYQFFASTQTPMLARVVQYNALYQIFVQFGLKSSQKFDTTTNPAATQAVREAVRMAMNLLKDGNETVIKKRLAPLASDYAKEIRQHARNKLLKLEWGLSSAEPEIDEQKIAEFTWISLMNEIRSVSAALRELSYQERGELVELLAAPRNVGLVRKSSYTVYKQIKKLGPAFAQLADPKIYQIYAANVRPRFGTWVHTPSVVISWNEFSNAIGGHDLAPMISTIKFQPHIDRIAAGQMASKQRVDKVGARELNRLVLGPRGPALGDAAAAGRPSRLALGLPEKLAIPKQLSGVATNPMTASSLPRPGEVHVARKTGGYRVVAQNTPEFAGWPMDFTRVKVSKAQFRSFPDGAVQIGISVKVPTTGTCRLLFRIKVAFKKAPELLGRLATKIQEVVERVISSFRGRTATPKQVGVEIKRQLRELVPEIDQLKINLQLEMSDLDIFQR
jgi:hypothetical protein